MATPPRDPVPGDAVPGDAVLRGSVDPDTVYPDTVYPDTVYPDTVYPDTVYPDTVPSLDAAMCRALELARRGPAHGPNPRVGCVLLAPADVGPRAGQSAGPRTVLGEGFHRGAGTPHAEIAALADARARGHDPRGATAIVTLEPCAHTGRTGPCAEALADAGIAEVSYALPDPNPQAAGGAARLRERGVRVALGPRGAEAAELVRVWATAVRRGTPFVTLKLATTLDGRIAAADGTSRWITGPPARANAHRLRTEVDAIAVGTGTALTDDPALTARPADGEPAAHQPIRVVVGRRDLPAGARLRGPGGRLVHLRTHDPHEVLAALAALEVRHVLIEGGPRLAAAFLAADLVDDLHAYIAPVLLGAGPAAVADLGRTTIGDAVRRRPVAVEQLGDDVLMITRRAADPAVPPAAAHSRLTDRDRTDRDRTDRNCDRHREESY